MYDYKGAPFTVYVDETSDVSKSVSNLSQAVLG